MIIADKIDKLIGEAILAKSRTLEILRAIKTKLIEYKSSKDAIPLDENSEIQLLRKMAKERDQSMQEYTKAGRYDLAEVELFEKVYLESLLPIEPTKNAIGATFKEILEERGIVCNEDLSDLSIPKSEMGYYIKEIKTRLPLSNGKAVSDIVKQYIK